MRGRSILTGLALLALLAVPRPASASWWDWMQEWSGPGPFGSGGNILATVGCPEFGVNQNKPCFYVDYRRFVAHENDNFPVKVTADAVDAGLTWRLRDSVELGFGLGITHASTDTASKNLFTVTAPRVVVKPIVLIGELIHGRRVLIKSSTNFASRLPHILKVYARESVMVGRFQAEDLGVSRTASPFNVKNDRITSMGFLIDVGELLSGR